MSRGWIDYLRRCSVLLQSRRAGADVAYFIGEDAPKMTGTRQPEFAARLPTTITLTPTCCSTARGWNKADSFCLTA